MPSRLNGARGEYQTFVQTLLRVLHGDIDFEYFREKMCFMYGDSQQTVVGVYQNIKSLVQLLRCLCFNLHLRQYMQLYDMATHSEQRLSERSVQKAAECFAKKEDVLCMIKCEYRHRTVFFFQIPADESFYRRIEDSWSSYVDRYISDRCTGTAGQPFLKRTCRKTRRGVHVHCEIVCRMAINSYRILFVEGEDVVYRSKKRVRKSVAKKHISPERREAFESFLSSSYKETAQRKRER